MLKIGPFSSDPNPAVNSSDEDNETVVAWDEKGKTKISQMFISYDTNYVKSLAFQYVEDGQCTLSPIFGCQNLDSPNFDTVRLMDDGGDSDEYITRVSGYHGYRYKGRGLTSLIIETNETTYGPFGKGSVNNDILFNFNLGRGDQFGGFHGTSCPFFVKSIGVHLKPMPIQERSSIVKRTQLLID